MVGEIRDGETAKISIEAALTGHLVLSTLHTNDAPSALTRLNEMGVEPFLTGAAVTGVLAQRLARKLCTHCCEMYTPSVDELIAARVSPDVAAASDGMAFYRKRGCPRCNQTGYKGRIGIYQLLAMTEELARLAATKASREEIERAALGERHADALGRRPREGRRRPDDHRRARPRHRLAPRLSPVQQRLRRAYNEPGAATARPEGVEMREPLQAVGAVTDRDYVEFWPAGTVASGRFRCTACGNSSDVKFVLRAASRAANAGEREDPPLRGRDRAERAASATSARWRSLQAVRVERERPDHRPCAAVPTAKKSAVALAETAFHFFFTFMRAFMTIASR